ncbi:MAG: SDR family oxidoreductase [Burkholderiaceae bacterium]|nr:SDR family oxidoreductase [Burkholderiaceae bacterium]
MDDRRRILMVTGGSRGIGAACARLAAAAGYDVCVNYAGDEAAARRTVAEVLAAGRRAVAVQADVGSEEDVVRLFEACDRTLGPVSALLNNAGVVAPASRVERMDAQRVMRVLRINVLGAFLAAREAVRRMSSRHGGAGGVIVNVSSAAARLGSPGEYVDYAASKAAVDTLTRGLALEVADEGIRVAGIRPGLIDTDIHRSQGAVGRLERLAPTVPMKRAGTAEEVARAALWLMSDDASYVTGTIVDVAGGR